jgi:purine-nucleoside/S-methyl-5'-thioadenosine phosphorylase / adenosine deaminase
MTDCSRPLPTGPARSRLLSEVPLPGPIPRFEIPAWRERFGVVAGITGRGVENNEPFDLGLWTEEPVGKVMGRWRTLRLAEPGFDGFVMAHQVHGAEVRWHHAAQGWTVLEGVDGHLTGTPGLMLLVTVADCIPVYLVDPTRRAVGLLHAGWRGIAAGILRHGIQLLEQVASSSPADLVIHCGVGICGECYEVGAEVMTGCGVASTGAGPWRLDLRARLAEQAQALGVGSISISSWCSGHDRSRFFSYRKSGGSDGRMVAYIGLPRTASG